MDTSTSKTEATETPFIQGFSNHQSDDSFDVTVHAASCADATEWTRGYFSLMTVQYLHSDFDGNHTYYVSPKDTREN